MLSATDAKRRFPELFDAAATRAERFEITAGGTDSAILLGARDFHTMRETIAVLSDPVFVAAHKAGVGVPVVGHTGLLGHTFTRGAQRVMYTIASTRRGVEVTAIGRRADAYADHRTF